MKKTIALVDRFYQENGLEEVIKKTSTELLPFAYMAPAIGYLSQNHVDLVIMNLYQVLLASSTEAKNHFKTLDPQLRQLATFHQGDAKHIKYGLYLLEKLRKDSPNKETPIMVVTQLHPETDARFLNAYAFASSKGATEYLMRNGTTGDLTLLERISYYLND